MAARVVHALGTHLRAGAVALAGCAWLLLGAGPASAEPANPAAPDVASYQLDVTLDPASKLVSGSGRITYHNPSSDVLSEVWLHLYLNAFRSADTPWMREAGGAHRGYAADDPGWIRVDQLSVAGSGASLPLPDGGDTSQTTVQVPLPEPLPPGGTLELDMRWTSRLPRVFARTGYAVDFFMVGQWYPKLAVYDRGQWDMEPWHANAEFYADFGTYDLAITVPEGYQTGASGERVAEERQAGGTRTVRYRAERVTDVAWTAWPEFRVVSSDVQAAGTTTRVELLLPPAEVGNADRHLAAARAALDFYGSWYGAYPWTKLTIVVPPPAAGGAGGMEYPTLVTTGGSGGLSIGTHEVEIVTAHEIAHEWFPMQVQSNEGAEAWLDEGFADYLTTRVLDRLYGTTRSAMDSPLGRSGYSQIQRGTFISSAARQPLAQPAWTFPTFQLYGATVYAKGSLALLGLERTLGDERLTAALRAYADRWRWRHPTSGDLQAAIEDATGEHLEWFFDGFVFGDGVVDYRVAGVDDSRVVVERTGDVAFPVDVRLDTADGTSQVQHWDGQGDRVEIDAGQPVRSVAIDPDERITLELNRLDNFREQQPRVLGPLALAGRWMAFVQAALQALAFLS